MLSIMAARSFHRLSACILSRVRRMTLVANERQNSTSTLGRFALMYNQYGDPKKVLEKKELVLPDKISSCSRTAVLVKMMMAPINPADINTLEGTYWMKPPLPAVAGNEGFGEVIEVGSDVRSLEPGDWVVPANPGWGTWRTHAVAEEADLLKISNDIPALSAATIVVNPCTAYRMLKDFVTLSERDVVIQNGANSAVGQNVIQLAKAWNLQTINIVRKRDNMDELVHQLKELGAVHVVTEEFSRTLEMKELIKSIGTPKLALNCVGGKSATELVRHLGQSGVIVTYGGMSKQPVTIPTGAFIFKEIKAFGYWNTQWNTDSKSNAEKRQMHIQMFDELTNLIKDCKLIPPASDLIPLSDYSSAIKAAMEGFKSKKKVFTMDESLVAYP